MRHIYFYTLIFFLTALTTAAQASDFQVWLTEFRQEARNSGVSESTLEAALSNIQPIPRVIELDRKQPEGTMTFAQYKQKVLSQDRTEKGKTNYLNYRATLDKIGKEFGVQPQYIVALWGLETSYGGYTGGFDIIPSLATLAHDGRRSDFFRKELLNALQIIDQGHISASAMKGSWAGAMGQSQFMPSSFLAYAVDYNGDGKKDIWNTEEDVFASAANYLARSGWIDGQRWGRAVSLPSGFNRELIKNKTEMPLASWSKQGVTLTNGQSLPQDNLIGYIIQEDGAGTPAYLVYNNFKTVLKWNKSNYFATSVGLLADSIAGTNE
jgi:membrane-bound lytic murein transglycosylase B